MAPTLIPSMMCWKNSAKRLRYFFGCPVFEASDPGLAPEVASPPEPLSGCIPSG